MSATSRDVFYCVACAQIVPERACACGGHVQAICLRDCPPVCSTAELARRARQALQAFRADVIRWRG